MKSPFRYFNSSPEVIRLVVMMYVKYPLSLRTVEDLLFERGIDICHETIRLGGSNSAHHRDANSRMGHFQSRPVSPKEVGLGLEPTGRPLTVEPWWNPKAKCVEVEPVPTNKVIQ